MAKLLNKALRHRKEAAKLGKQPAETQNYKIIDPNHQPDLHGQFAAVPVQRVGADQFVRLSDKQAKFYLDQGVIELADKPPPEEEQQQTNG